MHRTAAKTLTRFLMVGAMAVVLAGCSASYRNHGYLPPAEDLADIAVGIDTRSTVPDIIGAPAAAGLVGDSGLYYVQTRMRHFAYRRPEIVSREIVAISFDSAGVVRNIERFGLEDGQVIALERRITEPTAQGSGFLRQILGNLGNFNPGTFLN